MKVEKVPFVKNETTINVGDWVIATTTGAGRGNTRVGQYDGLLNGKVRIRTKTPSYQWLDSDGNVTHKWVNPKNRVSPILYSYRKEDRSCDYDAYNRDYQKFLADIVADREELGFRKVFYIKDGTTTLKNNRVVPISVFGFQFVGE